jgi:hypothetical protein
MHGAFALAATNDGPRGGALWGLAAEVLGMGESWRVQSFTCSVNLPYALSGRSCEGWSRVALILACNFDLLASGLRDLQQGGHVTFRIMYSCQDWRGRAHQKSTSLAVSRAALFAAFRQSVDGRGLDLVSCQAAPLARFLLVERLAELDLPAVDIDRLVEWALLREPVEYIAIPEEAPDRVAIRRATGAVDQGWFVGVGRPEVTLTRICEIQREIAQDVARRRDAAVRI